MKPTWEKPRTSRAYLHAPGSRRLLLIQPDFKITNLSLRRQPHTRQDACGVLVIAGREPEALDFHETVFDPVRDGLPMYTIRSSDPDNGASVSMLAFADDAEDPHTYVRVTVSNQENDPKSGRIGLLPRSVRQADQYLTGLWDTGYESYQPNWKQWLLQRKIRMNAIDAKSAQAEDGTANLRILSCEGFRIRWISRDEQKNRYLAHDYFACDYHLDPGESLTLDFVFCEKPFAEQPEPLDSVHTVMTRFWKKLLSRITEYPKTEAPRTRNMYLQNVTQCLQMFAHYDDIEGLVTRQGDVGRYLWVWEAVHILTALDRIGYTDLTTEAYESFCKWVILNPEDGMVGAYTYPNVVWDNQEGALLWGLSVHLQYDHRPKQLRKFHPYTKALFGYIEQKRNREINGPFPGIYPQGRASDWGEIGYHWTYTDAFVLRGVRCYAELCESLEFPEAASVRTACDEYQEAVLRVMHSLYEGHENDETFILPHIAGLSFESSYNHCFFTDGAPYLPLLGIMDPHSHMFEQMEAFFRESGFFEHGLSGRVTNATDYGIGAYGDCYYTGVAEVCWLYPWMERGEWDKVEEMHAALMRYNMTTEYIVSERYCSFDPWYTPWQPNGSGSARIVTYLLDYFDAKEKANR